MKKTIESISAYALLMILLCMSCEQNDRSAKNAALPGGAELAEQLGGLYFREGNVTAVKDIDNGTERLKLTLRNGGIQPHTVSVFLEKEDWNSLDVESGQFEVLYLKHALVLNDPQSGKQFTFKVPSGELRQLEAKLPQNYLSNAAIEAIGIAFQGPLPAMKGNPEFLK